MDYFQLKKDIGYKTIKNAYVFVGPEAFLKRSVIDELVASFVPQELVQLNVSIIENDINTKTIIDMCETLPFAADKRIVIIKDINFIKDDAEGLKALATYMNQISNMCCLIIIASEVLKQYTSIAKNACKVEFNQLSDNMLLNWMTEFAKKENVTLKKDSANLLLQYCLSDMTAIKNELDKLIIYSKDKNSVIDKDDVEQIATKSIQYNVFKMIDFFEQEKFDEAYEMYEAIKQEGGQTFALLGAIAARFRNVYYAKALIEKGVRGDALNKELKLNYYAAQSAIKATKVYSITQLNYIFELLNETDYSIKNGGAKEAEAIDNMLVHLFNKGKSDS